MGKGRRGAKRKAGSWNDDASPDTELRAAKHAARFAAFYKRQLLGDTLADDAEWDAMMEAMKRPLPVTFRITAAGGLAQRIEAELGELTNRCNGRVAALAAAPPAPAPPGDDPDREARAARACEPVALDCLGWVPGRRAWRLSAERTVIRKSPAHNELHKMLVAHEGAGTITRQEAVSMVPPLFLDAQRGDRVWDSCAAPGSKTTQLIESVFPPGTAPADALDGDPTGLVVANDENLMRAHTLVHQCKRLGSPAWVATHCDGTLYPGLRETRGGPRLLFDKILCDVPCSSDGTLRKTPRIMDKWSVGGGLGLHSLQLRIAQRGLQMLKPGGTLVYSTCSLNPYENEAVVAELLRGEPSLEVADASHLVPALKRRPGLRSWAVFDDGPTELDAPPLIEYATHGDVPEKRQSRFKPSHFPPAEEAVRDALRRCMRFVPHDDDTGGFFVTVLRKGGAAPEPAAEAAEESAPPAEPAAPEADAAPAPAPKIKDDAEREGKKAKVHMEDLGFSAFADNVDVAPLRDFYGLVDFPWHLLVCRSDSNDASKKVLLVSPAAKRLVLRAKDHKLRVVHAGVVALQRTSASARGAVDYRLSQDGIDLVLPFMTKRKVKCSAADFALLTDGGAKRIADLSVAAEVDALDAGGLAFYLDGDEPPALVAWKGNAGHVTAFAAKDDLTVLKSKLEALGVEEAC